LEDIYEDSRGAKSRVSKKRIEEDEDYVYSVHRRATGGQKPVTGGRQWIWIKP
jgi:hypothetical protein